MQAPVVVFGIERNEHHPTAHSISPHIQLLPTTGRPSQTAGIATSGSRRAAIDGVPILGDRVVTPTEALTILARESTLETAADSWGSHAKNPSALYLAEDAIGVGVLPDPLGGALVFVWRAGRGTYVSSSVPAIVEAAALFGEHPRKSLEYQLERSLIGNGGLIPASYEEMEALPVSTWLLIDEDGLHERRYDSFQSDLQIDGSYSDLIAQARTDIIESMTAIASMPVEQRISHLTGGFDSRLILAAVQAAGLADRFSFFTSGPTGTPDRDISDLLSKHFGLTRTNDAGLSAYPPSGYREQVLEPMTNSGGITSTGPTGKEDRIEVAAVGGGYGEVLRSFNSRLLDKIEPDPETGNWEPKSLGTALWGPYALKPGGLANDEATSRLLRRAADHFNDLQALDSPLDQLGDLHYLAVRNRYHIGHSSMLWSRHGYRFDPLYSRAGAKLSRMLPIGPRAQNVVGFDLMTSFSDELAALPFDKPRFAGDFSLYRRIPKQREYREGGFPTLPRSARYPAPALPPTSDADRRRFVAEANKFGVNYWQMAQLQPAQQGLRQALANIDERELAGTLNLDYVRRLASSQPRNRAEIRHLHSVYAMLLWYFAG